MDPMDRRSALKVSGVLLGGGMAAVLVRPGHALADKVIRIVINLPFTGGEAQDAALIKNGAVLAIEDINAKGGVAGYRLEPDLMDDGTSTAGGYDPAQAATNARRMISDPAVLVAVGPMNSGSGKAMSPILSEGSLATITPSSTNPDITDPKFAQQYRPAGKAIYFRTVTTDAYQGPNMANYYYDVLKLRDVYVLDDSGAYGVGLADAFEAQARKRGLKVLGRDRVDPKAADYSSVMTKIKGLNASSLYFGGNPQAGVKVVKQSYEAVPNIVKGGGDGIYEAEIVTAGGFPAAEGWYATIAGPHLLDDAAAQPWVQRYAARWNLQPNDYSITSYDAVLVIADAIARVAASGGPTTRAALRDAIEATHIQTMQGPISFDANGDLTSKVVSVFQIQRDPDHPLNDMIHQFKYKGLAPAAV